MEDAREGPQTLCLQTPRSWGQNAAQRERRREERRRWGVALADAREVLRRVVDTVIWRHVLWQDGVMRDLKAGWLRLRGLGCHGRGMDHLLDQRRCEVSNEIREALAEARGEALFLETVPRPKEEEWLRRAPRPAEAGTEQKTHRDAQRRVGGATSSGTAGPERTGPGGDA